MTPFSCVHLGDGWNKQKIQQFPADMTGKTQNVSSHTHRGLTIVLSHCILH